MEENALSYAIRQVLNFLSHKLEKQSVWEGMQCGLGSAKTEAREDWKLKICKDFQHNPIARQGRNGTR